MPVFFWESDPAVLAAYDPDPAGQDERDDERVTPQAAAPTSRSVRPR
jgi:hypothetical protein